VGLGFESRQPRHLRAVRRGIYTRRICSFFAQFGLVSGKVWVRAVHGLTTVSETGYTFENCTQFCVDGVQRHETVASDSPGFFGKRGPYAGNP